MRLGETMSCSLSRGRLMIYGKGGVHYAGTTEDTTLNGVSSRVTESNGGLTWGGGLQCHMLGRRAVRGEAQRYTKVGGGNIGDTDYNAYTIGLLYKMGEPHGGHAGLETHRRGVRRAGFAVARTAQGTAPAERHSYIGAAAARRSGGPALRRRAQLRRYERLGGRPRRLPVEQDPFRRNRLHQLRQSGLARTRSEGAAGKPPASPPGP